MWDQVVWVTRGGMICLNINWITLIQSRLSRSQILHFPDYTTCKTQPVTNCSCDFTMTAALNAQLLSNVFFPPRSGDPQRCWIGRLGCCQHHLCHLSCSAASCSSCDKTWVYSVAENTGLNLAARRCLSPHKPQPIFLAVSQGQSWTSLFVNLFCVFFFFKSFFTQRLWNSFNFSSTSLFQKNKLHVMEIWVRIPPPPKQENICSSNEKSLNMVVNFIQKTVII